MRVFLISLAIGLVFVYLSAPAHTVVHVYPTPDNVKNIQYRDKAGVCFQFEPSQMECPVDGSKIKHIPIQK